MGKSKAVVSPTTKEEWDQLKISAPTSDSMDMPFLAGHNPHFGPGKMLSKNMGKDDVTPMGETMPGSPPVPTSLPQLQLGRNAWEGDPNDGEGDKSDGFDAQLDAAVADTIRNQTKFNAAQRATEDKARQQMENRVAKKLANDHALPVDVDGGLVAADVSTV